MRLTLLISIFSTFLCIPSFMRSVAALLEQAAKFAMQHIIFIERFGSLKSNSLANLGMISKLSKKLISSVLFWQSILFSFIINVFIATRSILSNSAVISLALSS